MKKKYLISIIVFLIYIGFALFSIRFFLFNEGTIGHNWDWVVPELPGYYDYIMKIVKYNWADRVLGEPMLPLSFSTKIWFLGLVLMGKLFLGFKISHIIIISTIVVSGMTMFFLLKEIFSDRREGIFRDIACFFGGFFYAFSPFLYADFIGGSGGSFQTYAIFPLIFLFFINANRTNKFVYIFLTAAVLSIIALNFHNLFFACALIILYPLLFENKKRVYKKLIVVFFVFFLLNLYWIVPLGLSQFELKQYATREHILTLDNIIYNVPELNQILIGNGYIRDFYDFSIDDGIRPVWYSFSFLFVGVILFFSRFRSHGKIKKESFFWLAVFVISIILVTGGKEPFGYYVIWAFKNIAFFKFFRSPQFLIILPTFSLAFLIGIGMRNIFYSVKKTNIKLILSIILFAMVLVWLHPSFISGDLGMRKLYKIQKDRDHVDLFRLSDEHKKIYNFLNKQQDDFKVLWLPMQTSFYYLNTSYQKEGEGLDAHILFAPHSSIFVDHAYYEPSKSFVWIIEKKICEREILGKQERLFDVLNAKYIILRKDVEPVYSSCRGIWNATEIESMLDKFSLTKSFNGDYFVVYENKDFLDHIYAVNKYSFIENPKEFIKELEKSYFVPNETALFSFSEEIDLIDQREKEIRIKTGIKRSIIKLPIADFETGEEWDNGIYDFKNYISGRSGFKAVSKNYSMVRIQRYIDLNLSFFNKQIDRVAIDFYINNIENMHKNGFVIFFDSSGDNNDIFFYDPRKINFKTGWNHLVIKKEEFKRYGNPSWNNIKKIGIDVYSEENKTLEITFDNWIIYREDIFDIDKLDNRQLKNYEIYEHSSEEMVSIYELGNEKPQINFKKINPVKYEVILEEDAGSFLLVFLESFHSDWKLYKGDVNWLSSFLKKSNKNHFNANVYANAWYIYNGKKGDKFTIYYKKQNLFILFSLMSLFFLVIFAWRAFK